MHLPENVKYDIIGQFLTVITPEMRPNAREQAMLEEMEKEQAQCMHM